MSMIGYWIQRHDYSACEVSESSLTDTIHAFNAFDWQSELDVFESSVDGKDCPSGIGINNGKPLNENGGLLLHICPTDQHTVFFNFHYSKPSKIFGIHVGTSSEVHHVARFPRSVVPKLIEHFYHSRHQQIIEIE